jgi:hypothetical protein
MRTLATLQALPDHAWLRPIEVARLTGISRQGVAYALKSRLLPSTQHAARTWVRKAAALAYQTHNKWTGRGGRNLLPVRKVCRHCRKVFTGIKKTRYCSPLCQYTRYRPVRSRASNGVVTRTVVPSAAIT